jgi:hypothetical protein
MCDITRSEKNAGASAAGSQLAKAAARVNPLVGLAVAVGRPLVRLMRRRPGPPVAVRKMKLESYSASPVPPGLARRLAAQEGSKKDHKEIQEGSPARRPAVRLGPPRRPRASLVARKGGVHHG